jgi:hypothetical protein
MGADTATTLAAPSGPYVVDDRVRRLQRIGQIIELYEDLEHALARMDDRELHRIAARTRPDERPLAFWARRVARVRGVASPARHDLFEVHPRRRVASRGRFIWEAVAFAVGFGVSLLLIVGGT